MSAFVGTYVQTCKYPEEMGSITTLLFYQDHDIA